jgi:hypothetical protein
MLIPKKVIDNSLVKYPIFYPRFNCISISESGYCYCFFNLQAYELVQEGIDGLKNFRLLLGKSPEVRKEITLGEVLLQDIKEEIENFDLEKSQDKLVKSFI